MGFCTAKELVAAGKRDPNLSLYVGQRRESIAGIDEKRAEELLKLAFGDILTLNLPLKGNRPWQLVQLTEKLDPNQAWFGWEFEMGLQSEADFRRLVTYVWHEHNHVAFDREGAGRWSPEITFPPENASNFADGTAGILRLLNWMKSNRIKMVDADAIPNPIRGGGGTKIGQHLNVSTPSMRKKKNAVKCGMLIAHTMWMMSEAKHIDLFGRISYGLCRGRDQGAGAYCEYKLFKSTDDLKVFDKYIKVSQRAADLMEALCAKNDFGDATSVDTPYIENFYDILSGNTPPQDFKIAKAVGKNAYGKISDGEMWRYHQGLGPAVIA